MIKSEKLVEFEGIFCYIITYIRNNRKVFMNHPQWALKYKRRGTELRYLNGRYYLYEVTSKWDPKKKRAKKITGRLLGRITPEGFVESPKYALATRGFSGKVEVKEYGGSAILKYLTRSIEEGLRRIFPEYWGEIIVIAFLRFMYQSPMKNIGFYFEHSYLSEDMRGLRLGDKRLRMILREIGSNRGRIVEFFKLIYGGREDNYVLMDVSNMRSYSEGIEKAKKGYNGRMDYEPQVNLFFIYSESLEILVYYRILRGDIREVKGFKLSLEESGISKAVIIADKGFYSEENIKRMREEGLRFIIPLRRSNRLIDYSRAIKERKRGYESYFEYNGRFIWYYSYEVGEGMRVYFYLDEKLREREEEDYLLRIGTHPESYSREEFHKREMEFGTIALVTNMEESRAERVYSIYKSRENIELMFDTMKNTLQSDRSYMHNDESLEGWMFITFLALQCYYLLYQRLLRSDLISKYSPKDIVERAMEIKKVKINEEWHTSEITNKTIKLLQKLNLPIT